MVRRFLEEKSPESEVRRLMATRRATTRPCGPRWPRNSPCRPRRFLRSSGARASARSSCTWSLKRWARRCSVRLLSHRRAGGECAALRGQRRGQGGVLAGARLGRHDRDAARHGRTPVSGISGATSTTGETFGRGLCPGRCSQLRHRRIDCVAVARAGHDLKGPVAPSPSRATRTAVTRESLSTMDQTRKQSRIEFKGRGGWWCEEGGALAGLEATLQVAAAALAAEQVGGAQAGARRLGGVREESRPVRPTPIGSFQAIKHKCADMLLDVESRKSAAYYAAGPPKSATTSCRSRRSRQVVLFRGLLSLSRREHPDSRRDRLHLGASRATCISSARKVLNCSWATRRITVSYWPNV